MYQQAMPQFQQDMMGAADHFMQTRGLTDRQGQFDPTQGLQRGFGNMMSQTDGVFRAMGMDPSRMSPVQKAMILGGGAAAGGGAISGNPGVAGMGGLSMMGGMLPALLGGGGQGGPQNHLQTLTQGPTAPQSRDEWELMRRNQ